MKKPISFSWVSFSILLLLLIFIYGCNECTNEAKEIHRDSVSIYSQNYDAMIKSHPDWVNRVMRLTNKELSCLSKLSPKMVMFISASYDSTNEDSKFIIVKADDNPADTFRYYNLDAMYPHICPKALGYVPAPSNHICPPPTTGDCGIP